jgi:DNA repair exonuclease SbcCD ATPase subunit
MRLEHITLENIGTHAKFEQDFGPGLIGILGAQGSGKSTFTNSFFAALTNNFKRLADTKEQVIRQQAAKRETSRILVRATHAGTTFTLTRQLSPSTRTRLQTSHGGDWNKASEVERELEALLGASRQVLDSHVFVDQWQLRELLHQDPRERATTLSHLCRTAYIEKRQELVSGQLAADQLLHDSLGVLDVDALRQQLGALRATAAEHAQTATARAAEVLDAQTVAALRQSLADTAQVAQWRAEVVDKTARTASLAATFARLQSEQQSATALVQTCSEALAAAVQHTAHCQAELTSLTAAQAAYQWQTQAQTELSQLATALQAAPPTPPADPRSRTELERELLATGQQVAELWSRRQRLHGLVGSSYLNCPTCGQAIPDAPAKLAQAQAELAEVNAAANAAEDLQSRLRTAVAAQTSYQQARALYDQQQAQRTQRQQELTDQLAAATQVAAPASSPEVARAALSTAQAAERAAQQEVTAARTQVDGLLHRLAENQTQREILAAELAQAQAGIAATDALSEEDQAATHKLLADDQLVREALAAARALADDYARQVQEQAAALARAEQLRSRSQQVETWLGVLARTRDVLHRDNLPKRVHQRALRGMEQGINAMLGQFESPFRVQTADDLSYLCTFRDGTVTPDRRLSGGQQVVLMLSFRWVLNSIFANQIGMLILDEPTAGLDTRHVALLEAVLTNLSAVVRAQGAQVFIITHEQRLSHVFDQVVRLERSIL